MDDNRKGGNMKTLGAMLMVLTTLVFFSACGGEYKLKVEGLDDQEETVQGESQTNGEGTDSTADDGETAEGGGSQSSDDTTGGLQFLEPADPQETPRYFMGTYDLEDGYYYYETRCEQGFPGTIRLYSHDEVIDFETARGELFAIADLFEDKTFDFDVAFLDRFGKPSIDIVCVCYFNDAYYTYSQERFLCTCEPSNEKDSCGLIYEKMGAGE